MNVINYLYCATNRLRAWPNLTAEIWHCLLFIYIFFSSSSTSFFFFHFVWFLLSSYYFSYFLFLFFSFYFINNMNFVFINREAFIDLLYPRFWYGWYMAFKNFKLSLQSTRFFYFLWRMHNILVWFNRFILIFEYIFQNNVHINNFEYVFLFFVNYGF